MKKLIFVIGFLFLFVESYSQSGWFQQYYSPNVVNGSTKIFFISSQTGWLSYSQYGYCGLNKTTNGGNNWFSLDSTKNYITSICFIDQNTGWLCSGYFPGYQLGIIYKTTNGGLNWITQEYPINEYPVNDKNLTYIKFINEYIGYACGFIQYLYGQALVIDTYVLKTTNGGTNWTVPLRIMIGENFYWFKKLDLVDENNVWVGGNGGLFYRTTNGGLNWTHPSSNYGENYADLKLLNQNTGFLIYGYGGSSNGYPCKILKSINGGNNFNSICSTNIFRLRSISFLDENNGWMCGDSNTIKRTTNGGTNWISQSTPVFTDYNTVLFQNSSTGWLLGFSGHTLKTTTGGMTYLENISSNIPNKHSLSQNYPNPFNPSTYIKYHIANNKLITLKVYDILGKEMATLVNEKLSAGEYEVQFPNNQLTNVQLPSGIYFYSLFAEGNLIDTKKMVLLK